MLVFYVSLAKNRGKQTTGVHTSTPSITAFWARNRVMWLVRLKGAVSQWPGRTLSWPPPLFSISSIALSNAIVFTVLPSPTPPKSLRLNTTPLRFGIVLCLWTNRRWARSLSTAVRCQMKMRMNPTVQIMPREVLYDKKNDGTIRLWNRTFSGMIEKKKRKNEKGNQI